MFEDHQDITDFLQKNPDFTKDYFLKHATPKLVESWVMQRSHCLLIPDVKAVKKIESATSNDAMLKLLPTSTNIKLNRRLNKASESFFNDAPKNSNPMRKKKTFEELSELNQNDLFMELIRDIAYELDVDSLSHKILVNVCILTKCDRASLFLVKGHKERQYLVSHLFDVTVDSTVEEAVKPPEKKIFIPMGVGIAGLAASTGATINIEDAYKDKRFNASVDISTGYKTNSILCMPIKNQDNEVIGVAQIINKKVREQKFTAADEDVFRNYLIFCGIGLTNAQLFELSIAEYKRNQVLLNLARNIFEDTECLEIVVRRIMTQVQEVVRCERCTVYITEKVVNDDDEDEQVRFSKVFDMMHTEELPSDVSEAYWEDIANENINERKVYAGLAMLVVKSGECLNIDNFSKTTNEKLNSMEELISLQANTDFKPKCMLCCPIFDNQQEVIGVAQLLNKIGDHSFNENDEAIFEGFAIFCGLGLHNTQMYEKASMLLARQKVNLEILQYHAAETAEGLDDFAVLPVPPGDQFNLYSFDFDDFNMSDDETCLMSIRMFQDYELIKKFHIPYKTMCKFILTVKKNYRPVTYHNWRHAFNVAQSMFTLLHTGQMFSWFTDLETLVMIVGCLCHDLDHRGTNNTFQQKTDSPIATLYGTSTMERHHFDHSLMILNSEGSDIFSTLNEDDFKLAIKMLEDAILSTDLALYFKKRADFQQLVESHQANWTQFENRGVLRGMMMTACDVAAITKPWNIQQRVAEFVASEFFEQGDQERLALSTEPMPMMDRHKHKELPKMQVGFIDFVCMPIYKVFYHINPLLKPLYDGVLNNRKQWTSIVDTYEPKGVEVASARGASGGGARRPSIKQTRASQQNKKVSFDVGGTEKSRACHIL